MSLVYILLMSIHSVWLWYVFVPFLVDLVEQGGDALLRRCRDDPNLSRLRR